MEKFGELTSRPTGLRKWQLAAELAVSQGTIDNWRKQGLPFMKIGAVIIFSLEEVLDWMKRNGRR